MADSVSLPNGNTVSLDDKQVTLIVESLEDRRQLLLHIPDPDPDVKAEISDIEALTDTLSNPG